MKALGIVALIVIGLIVVGCTSTTSNPTLAVTVTPGHGRPPFDVTITARCSVDGGTYALSINGAAAIESDSGVFTETVKSAPWNYTVTWEKHGSTASYSGSVVVENKPPIIRKPWINVGWSVSPYTPVTIDMRYSAELKTGINDPDGDTWTVDSVVIKCDNKRKNDTLFFPTMFTVEKFHVDSGNGCSTHDIYPAAVWFPAYTATKYTSSPRLPKYPWQFGGPLAGYVRAQTAPTTAFREQEATITITASDEFGASTTKSFRIHIKHYMGP